MVPQLGAPIGFIAANGIFLLLNSLVGPDDMLRWGWRIPFLASALLVGLGLWVRLKLTETPAFAAVSKEAPPEAVPIATVLRDHLHAVLAGTLGGITCFAIFYLTTAFLLGYGTNALGYGRGEFLLAQIGGDTVPRHRHLALRFAVGSLFAQNGAHDWVRRHAGAGRTADGADGRSGSIGFLSSIFRSRCFAWASLMGR